MEAVSSKHDETPRPGCFRHGAVREGLATSCDLICMVAPDCGCASHSLGTRAICLFGYFEQLIIIRYNCITRNSTTVLDR